MKFSTLSLMALSFSLTACASSWGIGESKLSCDAETGMGCTGIRAAYMATDNYSPEQDAKNHWTHKSKAKTAKAYEYGYQRHGEIADFVPTSPSVIPTSMAHGQIARPIRQPEQVMRVWVNAHQDTDGNLIYPSHTFTQVSEAKWIVGNAPFKSVSTKTILPPKAVTTANTVDTNTEAANAAQQVFANTAQSEPNDPFSSGNPPAPLAE